MSVAVCGAHNCLKWNRCQLNSWYYVPCDIHVTTRADASGSSIPPFVCCQIAVSNPRPEFRDSNRTYACGAQLRLTLKRGRMLAPEPSSMTQAKTSSQRLFWRSRPTVVACVDSLMSTARTSVKASATLGLAIKSGL